jgi:hypothetical protein
MTDLSLVFVPLIPWAALAGLGALALAIFGYASYAGQKDAAWRLLAVGLFLLALAGPETRREERVAEKSVVALVLDKSESQTLGARMSQVEKARKGLEQALAKFPDVETRIVSVEDSSDGTMLFSGLAQALKDTPPDRVAGAILLTDGLAHDIPAKPEALGFNAPVHALITGHAGERDRRLELVDAPRFGVVGKPLTLRVKVVDSPSTDGFAEIVARRDGAVVARRRAAVGDEVEIAVPIEHGGPNVVEIETPPVEGELTDVDNRAVLTIEGVRDRLKVMLVSGEPHPGERSWRNLLRADANVELVHFTILRPPEKIDGAQAHELSLIAFPTADLFGRKIKDFDLIIFDRYSNQTLLPSVYFENVAQYVENGGAFLAMVGPDFATLRGLYYSPLSNILPARPDGTVFEQAFRARIAKDGEKHPVTRGLAGAEGEAANWGQWFRQVDSVVLKGSTVLAGANDKPLLVLAREGKGRVGMLLTDQLWLWARGYDGGGPHVDLMRRLAHWLLKEPELEEEALRATASGRDIAIERQSLKEETSALTVTAPSGEKSEVTLTPKEPGLFRAQWRAKEMGLHRFESGGLTALANVGPQNPREFREVASTPDKLRPLLEATGGTVRRLATGSADTVSLPRVLQLRDANSYGGADWIAVKRGAASALKGVETTPLAQGFAAMCALVGAALLVWSMEGRRWKGAPRK